MLAGVRPVSFTFGSPENRRRRDPSRRLSGSSNWRPLRPDDQPFLRALFIACRAEEWILLAPDRATQNQLIDLQFAARERDYRTWSPLPERRVIEVEGEAVGSITLQRAPDRLRLVELDLLPAWRGRGIGTRTISALLEEARAAALPVHAELSDGCRAERLLRRLGFTTQHADRLALRMRWLPTASAWSRLEPTVPQGPADGGRTGNPLR